MLFGFCTNYSQETQKWSREFTLCLLLKQNELWIFNCLTRVGPNTKENRPGLAIATTPLVHILLVHIQYSSVLWKRSQSTIEWFNWNFVYWREPSKKGGIRDVKPSLREQARSFDHEMSLDRDQKPFNRAIGIRGARGRQWGDDGATME